MVTLRTHVSIVLMPASELGEERTRNYVRIYSRYVLDLNSGANCVGTSSTNWSHNQPAP